MNCKESEPLVTLGAFPEYKGSDLEYTRQLAVYAVKAKAANKENILKRTFTAECIQNLRDEGMIK